MKYNLIILIITAFIFISCKQNKTDDYSKPSEVTITGTINNFEKYPDANVVDLNVYNVGLSKQETFYGKIDSVGKFKIKFPIYLSQDVWISYRTGFVFLIHPGDSINIDFNADIDNSVEIYETLKFSGDASESNSQLAKYLEVYYANFLSSDDYFKYHKELATNEFVAFRDSIKKVMNERRDKFIKESNPTDEVKLWTYWNVEADNMNELLLHSYQYTSENALKLNDWKYENSYYNFLDSLNKIDEYSLINTSVSSQLPNYILGFYIGGKIRQQNDSLYSVGKIDSILFNTVTGFEKSDLIKQLMITQFVNFSLEDYDTTAYVKYKTQINKYVTAPYLIKPLKAKYKKVKDYLNNPEISSKTIMDSISTSDAKEIFNSILAKHKNKALYIDCWATWCSPCRTEMPYSKKLMEKFEGQNIEFVFLCLDSEKDQWKASLTELQIGGTHYFLNKAESSALRNILGISGVPHYLLIDKNGVIIKQGFDIRPSTGMAESEIQKIL
jgi:thiol-disulfide isomerase/thioredoxin